MSETPQIDRQREHQANERTFLAWLRTSIALIGFGFAIARFGLFLRELQSAVTGENVRSQPFINSQTLGVGLVILGVLLIGLSAWRYNRVFWQIERGNYRPNRLTVWITAAAVAILGLLSIPFVLWQRPPAPSTPPPPRSGRHSWLPNRNLLFSGVRLGNAKSVLTFPTGGIFHALSDRFNSIGLKPTAKGKVFLPYFISEKRFKIYKPAIKRRGKLEKWQ